MLSIVFYFVYFIFAPELTKTKKNEEINFNNNNFFANH